ncbi:hypothetical protein Patl1_05071 [Pistacia atlantica]|uniref:Uncharacterized protein n=1 Tax=Pistacia atlantica TaxID=434234 RepID=A0ACC1BVQ5_9ROSI|nr:hypothetical protein Patl1_05071 [Pistacia atlantica]
MGSLNGSIICPPSAAAVHSKQPRAQTFPVNSCRLTDIRSELWGFNGFPGQLKTQNSKTLKCNFSSSPKFNATSMAKNFNESDQHSVNSSAVKTGKICHTMSKLRQHLASCISPPTADLVFDAGRRTWYTSGEQQEAAKKEFIEIIKLLEEQLGDKPYFGGETFGYVDVCLIPYYCWFYTYETMGKFSLEAECPKFIAWAKRCMQIESISKTLPDEKKVFGFCLELRKKFGLE